MNKKYLKYLPLLLPLLLLASCLGTTTTVTTPSSTPTFTSLKFGVNDSIPALSYASFSLTYDASIGDSIIVNLDSLPVNTRIDSVFPTFSFKSTSKTKLLLKDSQGIPKDTVTLTGKDTIDFTKVVSVTNVSEDGTKERTYKIKVNVHQLEGKLYVWKRLVNSITDISASEQKVVFFQNKFFFYTGSGVKNSLFTSINASDWLQETVTGLPAGISLRGMCVYNQSLYLTSDDGKIYISADGYKWTSNDVNPSGYEAVNILFELQGKLLGILKSTNSGDYHFADTQDGINWNVKAIIPDKFPVGDFASLSFYSRTKKAKALILGGFDKDRNLLRNVWSTEDGSYWVDFSLENTSMSNLSGASVISYGDSLLLFGGMNANHVIIGTGYFKSVDEGLSWKAVDSTYNTIYDKNLSASYIPRSYQSVILKDDIHQIFLIGGKTRTVSFTDVWSGKLNKLSFLIQK